MRFLPILVAVFAFLNMAAPPEKVTIQTNAICEMCKVSIEKNLLAIEGVQKAELDLVTKKVKIKFDDALVDVATLRQAIANTGYEADDVPPRPKAQANLANCCKPEELKEKTCSKSCAKTCDDEEGTK
ncbi:heavy-metal-associated domain-containing protein [Neolewinella antarctica]|uniref:Copper chaperone CopZ n=1 Tax=Neolewinella antarctica TaxID=442734 RepID=A0ABX0X8Q8_9BACT|nr:heavy metal-associated domain-containing protein [Neolewinella antarctica]NJC25339.1 copper chaperone CopZ [Neolewinella antarctica]